MDGAFEFEGTVKIIQSHPSMGRGKFQYPSLLQPGLGHFQVGATSVSLGNLFFPHDKIIHLGLLVIQFPFIKGGQAFPILSHHTRLTFLYIITSKAVKSDLGPPVFLKTELIIKIADNEIAVVDS